MYSVFSVSLYGALLGRSILCSMGSLSKCTTGSTFSRFETFWF